MAKEGKYNLFYKDFDSVRDIVRSAFLYGGYSKADYCALTGISTRKYEDCIRFMREAFGDNYAYDNVGKEKYARLNYKAFETAANPLARAAAFRGFTYNDFNCYFHALDLLSDKLGGMMVEQMLDAFCDRGIVCDRGTVRNGLEAMVADGYLLKVQSGKKTFYKITNDLSNKFSIEELEQLSDYLSLAKNLGRYRIPLYSLASKMPDSDFGNNVKIGGYYPVQVLDEEVRFALETAISRKRIVKFDYSLFVQEERKNMIYTTQLVARPIKLFEGDYGRQYVFCFEGDSMNSKVCRLDRIRHVEITNTVIDAEFDESYLDNSWCVSIPKNQEISNLEIDFDFGDDKSLARRLERNKKIGAVSKKGEGKYRFSIKIKDYAEMIPFLRTFYAYIVKINNESFKQRIADDLKEMGGAYGVD